MDRPGDHGGHWLNQRMPAWQDMESRLPALEARKPLSIGALQAARQFVRGRILTGLKLIGAEAVSFLALVLAVIVVLAPIALLAGATFLRFSGWPAAAVIGVVIALPALLAIVGAHGTYRSALWTHGYLAARSA